MSDGGEVYGSEVEVREGWGALEDELWRDAGEDQGKAAQLLAL